MEVFKVRFVLGGRRDREKTSQVHNATTLRHASTRILVALAVILGFDVWSTDVNHAYLQSAQNLKRNSFIRPDILELSADELLQVIKPLYGLTESGDYWGETVTDHHRKDLRMESAHGDLSLFFKRLAGNLIGLSGAYVDDLLRAGNKDFYDQSTKTTNDAFDTKISAFPPFTFTGIEITGDRNERYLSQAGYLQRIDYLKRMLLSIHSDLYEPSYCG